MAGGGRHFSGAEKRERIAHGRPPLEAALAEARRVRAGALA
jgi:hypothetical protein